MTRRRPANYYSTDLRRIERPKSNLPISSGVPRRSQTVPKAHRHIAVAQRANRIWLLVAPATADILAEIFALGHIAPTIFSLPTDWGGGWLYLCKQQRPVVVLPAMTWGAMWNFFHPAHAREGRK